MKDINSVISPELVRKELISILGFEDLRHSPILSKFLEYVVLKKLAGDEQEIKEYTIGVEALGRPSDFNPQLDAVVRIHAGRLRRILFQYYQGDGKNDPVIISIPKGSYIPQFDLFEAGTALPITSKETYTVEAPGLPEDSIATHTAYATPVLVVLPFHNLSPENSQDYFVAGIGEQLSSDLARFQNISVISYYSSYRYDTDVRDLREMKDFINLDYALTGSVRFTSDKVRLNVQLIFANNGEIIWTGSYQRHITPKNVFDIQEEIVSQVLNSIADDNGIIHKKKPSYSSLYTRPKNSEVHEAIIKYFDYTSDYKPEKFATALESLEKAVAIEPSHALASALLANAYFDMYCNDIIQRPELLEKAQSFANAAVQYDHYCQHAQKVLAWTLLVSGHEAKALEVMEYAIHLNPKASGVVSSMALGFVCMGSYSKGFGWLLESIHLNPIASVSTKLGFALYYFSTGNYTESIKWLDLMELYEVPVIALLRLAAKGQLNNGHVSEIDQALLSLGENSENMINRFIPGKKLSTEIMEGLRLAGLTVK